jgi:hypothetical protein
MKMKTKLVDNKDSIVGFISSYGDYWCLLCAKREVGHNDIEFTSIETIDLTTNLKTALHACVNCETAIWNKSGSRSLGINSFSFEYNDRNIIVILNIPGVTPVACADTNFVAKIGPELDYYNNQIRVKTTMPGFEGLRNLINNALINLRNSKYTWLAYVYNQEIKKRSKDKYTFANEIAVSWNKLPYRESF